MGSGTHLYSRTQEASGRADATSIEESTVGFKYLAVTQSVCVCVCVRVCVCVCVGK